MKRLTTVLMTALLLTALRAGAQIAPGSNQASFNLGLTNPLSSDNDNGDHQDIGGLGPQFGFTFLHTMTGQLKNLSLGGDINFKGFSDQNVVTGHGPVDVHSGAWTLLALARGDLMPESNVRPYGILGLGVGGFRTEWDYQNSRFSNTRTSGGLAMALGGGVDFDINTRWLVGGEARYTLIGTDSGDVGTSSVSTFDLLAKVGYKF